MKQEMEKEPRMEKERSQNGRRGNKGQAEAAKKRRGFWAWCLVCLAMAASACSSDSEEILPPDTSPPEAVLGLSVDIVHSSATLTPMETETYSERSTTFMLRVSRPEADESVELEKVQLEIAPVEGLRFEVKSSFEGEVKTFEVSVHYNGKSAFPEGWATLQLGLNVPEGQHATTRTLRIAVADGREGARSIPVNKANLEHFNHYADTIDGRWMHYRLTEDIVLEPPAPGQSNWRPIGIRTRFAGSFDGGGHTLSGLTRSSGLFAGTHEEAVIENIRLIDVEVSSLVETNNGTVRNCHIAGNASLMNINTGMVDNCSANIRSGMVNNNSGTIQNSHAIVEITLSRRFSAVGGLVGVNSGTVRNCYATGSISGSTAGDLYEDGVGGLVGRNETSLESKWNRYGLGVIGVVQDSYAIVNISLSTSSRAGGLVGMNTGGIVQNCYAAGDVSGGDADDNRVGGLVGMNSVGVATRIREGNDDKETYVGGIVRNSYATGNVSGKGGLKPEYWSSRPGVGGVVGLNHGSTVQSCYSTGSVRGTGNHVGGVVGRNETWYANHRYRPGYPQLEAIVKDCMALNPSVALSGGTDMGRVAGFNLLKADISKQDDIDSILSNNAAFAGMTGRTWTNIAEDKLDGQSLTAAQVHNLRTVPSLAKVFDSGPWTYEPGRLPGLFGKTVDMPGHIPAN